MKNNYPIKYAVMPIYGQVGWIHGLNELEREYDVIAYIASKCYVVSEKKKYDKSGKFNIEYEVVYPFVNNDGWKRIEPDYSYFNQKYINSNIVNEVYENYQDALEKAKLQNKEIITQKISYLPYSDQIHETIAEIKAIHNDMLSTYENIQRQIEENTFDLIVNDVPKEQNIIVIYDEESKKINGYKDKLMDISLYDYINLNDYGYFYACNVSKENYELMKKQLKETGKIDEEQLGIVNRYLLANDRETRNIRIVDFDSKKEKGCFYLTDNRYMKYDENMTKFYQEDKEKFVRNIKIYTTETYEDIIKSYIPKFIANTDETIELDGKIIRKKLVLK